MFAVDFPINKPSDSAIRKCLFYILGRLNQLLIELDDGKIYRKPLYLMVKPWFPVNFPLNQSIELRNGRAYFFRVNTSRVRTTIWAQARWIGTEQVGLMPGLSLKTSNFIMYYHRFI